MTYLCLLYGALSAVQLAGWGPAWAYFGILWLVPVFTTFPLFMILRQWVQHGNADRGRYTNTRVFLVGPHRALCGVPVRAWTITCRTTSWRPCRTTT